MRLCSVTALAVLLCLPARAQETPRSHPPDTLAELPPRPLVPQHAGHGPDLSGGGQDLPMDPTQAVPAPPVQKSASGEWVAVPIPGHNPSQGWSLKLIGQYIFHPVHRDTLSPPSILAVGGFYTALKSFGLFGGFVGFFGENRWRPLLGGGYARLNYDFFGIGNEAGSLDRSIRIEQENVIALGQVTRRLLPGLYLGPRVLYNNLNVNPRLPADLPPHLADLLPEIALDIRTVALGLKVQWDTRDNIFAPTRGTLVNLQADFFDGAYGSDVTYQAYQFDANQYVQLFDRGVLAARAALRRSGGDVPFFGLALFGQYNDLRGYTVGKYRDRSLLAAQVEYRHLTFGGRGLVRRLGAVAFAGLGEVAPGLGDLSTDALLGSVGIGLRFRVTEENPINLRLDWAYGADGSTFYLGVNEAF